QQTVQRSRSCHRTPPSSAPRRRGPMGALSDATLAAAIKAVLAASPFHGEGHRQVSARLRYAGIRTSLRRVLRLMREHDLLAPGRVGSPRCPRSHDGTIVPDTIEAMWAAALTTTFTGGGPGLHSGPCASHTLRGSGTDPPGRAP